MFKPKSIDSIPKWHIFFKETYNRVVHQHRVILSEMINKIPVETTHLPAHPSSAGVTHVHTGALAAAISHNKSASVTYPVPSGASHRNQSLSLGRFHDGCLCLLRSQVIYLHGGTNDRRKRTSNHSCTPFHAYSIFKGLQAASLM